MQTHVRHITLADTSTGMLDVLREKIAAAGIVNMTPVRLDLTADPLPAERFDLIYSLMTFHHIADTGRILSDLHALLAARGYLCIADLDREDGSFHGAAFSGHRGFDREELARKTERAGFHKVQFSSVFSIRKGQPPRDYPVFLMTAEKR